MTEAVGIAHRAAAARKAVEAAGGGAALARLCGVTRYAVQQWKGAGVPAGKLPLVSRITGIPMEELRPDLFGSAPPAAPAEAA